MTRSCFPLLSFCVLLLVSLILVESFHHPKSERRKSPLLESHSSSRREFLAGSAGYLVGSIFAVSAPFFNPHQARAEASSSTLADLTGLLKQSKTQLDEVPALIKAQKWDSVRAILITPPLCDCWAKTNRPLLQSYADVLGDRGGDELAALEGKEELISHLRYLDMAVYNNVFNPIATEGESGATKELVRSYYEDPINEYNAVNKAFGELLELSDGL